MGKIKLPVVICLTLLANVLYSQNNIIPAPVRYTSSDASFIFNDQVTVDVQTKKADVKSIADYFVASLKDKGLTLKQGSVPKPDKEHRSISISLNNKPNDVIGDEGYTLSVTDAIIEVKANTPQGIFYAIQTLWQLLPPAFSDAQSASVGGCFITDYPRFKWRGLMLDVSRHFFTKEEVKKYIDVMAQYKFNTFHWHLTDDNGWRIEIKSLPKLTEVGAWRVERFGRFGNRETPKPGEPTPYGGFYTHDDIREIIQYAAERQITIVPEIDVPGHSMAALAAYPELSCKKEPKMVNPGTSFSEWYGNGKFKMLVENTLNPSDEKVYDFLDKVFTEVAALFPAPYIHVGGDEAYHGFWEEDPNCKALMKKNNLKDGHELQSYFMKRVEKIITKNGKKMIGWDEILEGGLAPGAAVMSWRGMKGGIEAAKLGHDVVMSPTTFAYLDYTQGDRSIENPIYADLSLRKSYEFEPVPEGVDSKYILGGQANLWTEQIPTLRYAFYMTYPRALATAESVWSGKEKKDYDNFITRVETHFDRFDALQLNISKAVLDPIVKVRMENGKLTCTLACDVRGADTFYTLDNTFPDKYSPKFTGAFEIPEGEVTLKVITYRDGKPLGRMLSIKREDLVKRAGR